MRKSLPFFLKDFKDSFKFFKDFFLRLDFFF